jgi:hypothetical protein
LEDVMWRAARARIMWRTGLGGQFGRNLSESVVVLACRKDA